MASKKRGFEDTLENVKAIMAKEQKLKEEVQAQKEKIFKKYNKRFKDLEGVKEKIDEKIDLLRLEMVAKQDESTREITKHIKISDIVPEIVEDLELVLKGQRIIYPAKCDNDNCLACCVYAMLDGGETEDELAHFFEYLGVAEENRKEFRSLVKETLTIDEEEATIDMEGKVEGYKGDETRFDVEEGSVPKIAFDYYAKSSSRIDWAKELEGLVPNDDDICWPSCRDSSGWASAVASFNVWVVGLKKK